MPATSEKQKVLMCLALAIKRGKASAKKYPTAAKTAQSMSEADLRDYCKGPVQK